VETLHAHKSVLPALDQTGLWSNGGRLPHRRCVELAVGPFVAREALVLYSVSSSSPDDFLNLRRP